MLSNLSRCAKRSFVTNSWFGKKCWPRTPRIFHALFFRTFTHLIDASEDWPPYPLNLNPLKKPANHPDTIPTLFIRNYFGIYNGLEIIGSFQAKSENWKVHKNQKSSDTSLSLVYWNQHLSANPDPKPIFLRGTLEHPRTEKSKCWDYFTSSLFLLTIECFWETAIFPVVGCCQGRWTAGPVWWI